MLIKQNISFFLISNDVFLFQKSLLYKQNNAYAQAHKQTTLSLKKVSYFANSHLPTLIKMDHFFAVYFKHFFVQKPSRLHATSRTYIPEITANQHKRNCVITIDYFFTMYVARTTLKENIFNSINSHTTKTFIYQKFLFLSSHKDSRSMIYKQKTATIIIEVFDQVS